MISQKSKKIKYLTQSIYNQYLFSLHLNECVCSCGAKGRFHMHGTYTRWIKTPLGRLKLHIQRVKCIACECTHALIPESIIPYSHIVYCDTVAIIIAYEKKESLRFLLDHNPELTETDITRTIKKYKRFWKERLRVVFEFITPTIFNRDDFFSMLSKFFHLCFMQVKRCFYGHQ